MIGSQQDEGFDQLVGSFRSLCNQNYRFFDKCIHRLQGKSNPLLDKYSVLSIKSYYPSEAMIRNYGMELLQDFYNTLSRTEDVQALEQTTKEIDDLLRQAYAVLNQKLIDCSTDAALIKKTQDDFNKLEKNAMTTLRKNLDQTLV